MSDRGPFGTLGLAALPGDYSIIRYGASVAVCTLNSDDLMKHIAAAAPEGLAIIGTMLTENLGIERVIRNVLANPNIRHLILCGDDTRQLVGHLPGQSMEIEHYTNAGVLDCTVQGSTPVAIYVEIVKRGLVSQLDHAAYLGRELANAEHSLRAGTRYIQDRAPGEPLSAPADSATTDRCDPSCTSCQ